MNRIAAVIDSRRDGAGKSAVYRAMMSVDELRRGGDGVALVFDGASRGRRGRTRTWRCPGTWFIRGTAVDTELQ